MTLSDILHPYVHFMISYLAYCEYLCVHVCVSVCVSLHSQPCVLCVLWLSVLLYFILLFLLLGLVDMDRVV